MKYRYLVLFLSVFSTSVMAIHSDEKPKDLDAAL